MAGVHAIIDRKVATNHVCASSGGVAGESFGRIMLSICAVFAIVDADDAGVAMTCNGRLEHRLGPVSAFAETYHGRVSNYNCTIGMTIGGFLAMTTTTTRLTIAFASGFRLQTATRICGSAMCAAVNALGKRPPPTHVRSTRLTGVLRRHVAGRKTKSLALTIEIHCVEHDDMLESRKRWTCLVWLGSSSKICRFWLKRRAVKLYVSYVSHRRKG